MTPKRSAGQSARSAFRGRMLTLVALVFVGMTLDVTLYFSPWRTSHPWVYLAVIALIILAFKVIDWRSVRIDRTWGDGARAEERLGRLLEPLESDGWIVLHDLDTGRGNIDHVAVGPTGIYTIETKSHKGRITCDGGHLLRNNRPLEKNFLKQAVAESMAVRDHLKAHLDQEHYVTAVLCFTRASVDIRGDRTGAVQVLPGKWLIDRLTRGRCRYTQEEIAQIGTAIGNMTQVAKT